MAEPPYTAIMSILSNTFNGFITMPDAFILHTRQDPSISGNDLVLDKYRQVGSESGFFGGGGVANLCDRRTGIGV